MVENFSNNPRWSLIFFAENNILTRIQIRSKDTDPKNWKCWQPGVLSAVSLWKWTLVKSGFGPCYKLTKGFVTFVFHPPPLEFIVSHFVEARFIFFYRLEFEKEIPKYDFNPIDDFTYCVFINFNHVAKKLIKWDAIWILKYHKIHWYPRLSQFWIFAVYGLRKTWPRLGSSE